MNIVIILSLIPAVIWLFMEQLSVRFADLSSIATSIGQILGLVGMSLFSINLILAGRFKLLDKYFKGLDKVYQNHSKIGAIAFSLILFHPLFLVVKYILISTQDAAMFFVPFVNIPVTWGIISLAIMILLIAFTFYIKLKYNTWKISHKFMVVAFIFGIMHTFLIKSDISRNLLLKDYILLLAFVGLFVSVRKAFLDKVVIEKFKYKVKNVNILNKDIVEVEMEPSANKMNFISGQFAFFEFLNGGVSSESHPFSIASSSGENNLRIIVKNLGDFTSSLGNLSVGSSVLIDGSYGHFSYKNVWNKNQIWIAGGIGVTPFLSMARSLDKDYNINFFYSVKEEGEAIYLNELKEISERNPNFKFTLWSAKEKGYINSEMISSSSGGAIDKDILMCGPGVFMESLEGQFVKLGVDIKKVHYEKFSL